MIPKPYPTPIQQHRAQPSKRVAPFRIGPTCQREILSNAIGVPLVPIAAAAQDNSAKKRGSVGRGTRESPSTDSSFISRIYSAQIPSQSFPANRLVDALEKELKRHTINADDYFIDHLFPVGLLPAGMSDEAVLAELSKQHDEKPSIWINELRRFRNMPLKEEALADWLNSIGNTLGNAFGRDPLRLWSHISCDTPPIGASATIKRKPDLILLDKNHHSELLVSNKQVDWAFIRAITEVTRSPEISKRVTDTIYAKTYLMFLCQYNRRFVVALSFSNAKEESFRLTVTNREGQICWTVGLNAARSKERATLFLRILVLNVWKACGYWA